MDKMDRRRFVVAGAAAAASLKSLAQNTTEAPGAETSAHLARLTLTPQVIGAPIVIPENFVGLSYEIQQLSDPKFFSPKNTGLIARCRELALHGVLRLGGNTSDYAFWKPTPDAVPPPRAKRPYKVGDPPPDLTYNVTPEAVRNLRAFLDATGWTCLYGINLGTNTPEIAADEAAFVSKTLGAKLEYFQVGNEADRFGSTIRDPKTWNADTYFTEWLTFANAIRKAVPSARFGLPDTAGNPEWYATVVTRLLALADPPAIAALTHHYYFIGPPDNPKATIDNLLHGDPHVERLYSDIHAATQRLDEGEHWRTVYRMTEGNTCYRGGKPGFSDVYAASLWAADYLLKLASLGYAGVNLHGGTAKFVAMSLGGKLPGEDLMADPNAPHPKPFYTPIAQIDDKYVLEPVAYGMMFAQRFAGATVVPVAFDPGPVNATAYAARHPDGRQLVAVINKDATQSLRLNLTGGGWRTSERLTGKSLDGTDVKLTPATDLGLHIPAASGAILEWVSRRDQFGTR
ncbi:MAG TPA: hypothetical protein VN612_00585 [Acidobacteriaceae bacterium]|nr:hypothetical protein [Acidobacteriaceae bacterium]